jgi:hypothetical protein
MTYDRPLFSKISEHVGGMVVELGDEATYLVRGVGPISFQMPLGDVLELDNVLYVLGLKKNLILVLI